MSEAGTIQLDQNHYQNKRDKELRISKAAIDRFLDNGNSVELFLSFYKDDLYTVENLNEYPSSMSKLDINLDSVDIRIQSIYHIDLYIDDNMIPDPAPSVFDPLYFH